MLKFTTANVGILVMLFSGQMGDQLGNPREDSHLDNSRRHLGDALDSGRGEDDSSRTPDAANTNHEVSFRLE
jgi:hypothetical protein